MHFFKGTFTGWEVWVVSDQSQGESLPEVWVYKLTLTEKTPTGQKYQINVISTISNKGSQIVKYHPLVEAIEEQEWIESTDGIKWRQMLKIYRIVNIRTLWNIHGFLLRLNFKNHRYFCFMLQKTWRVSKRSCVLNPLVSFGEKEKQTAIFGLIFGFTAMVDNCTYFDIDKECPTFERWTF